MLSTIFDEPDVLKIHTMPKFFIQRHLRGDTKLIRPLIVMIPRDKGSAEN